MTFHLLEKCNSLVTRTKLRKLILRQIPRVVDLATYGALNSIVLQSFMIECYLQRNIRLLVVSKLTLFNDSQTCELWRFCCRLRFWLSFSGYSESRFFGFLACSKHLVSILLTLIWVQCSLSIITSYKQTVFFWAIGVLQCKICLLNWSYRLSNLFGASWLEAILLFVQKIEIPQIRKI